MHQTSGRWRYGIALALLTTLMWGLLSIALKLLLLQMDPYSITWYRMLVASVVLGLILKVRGNFPDWRKLKGWSGIFMLIAVLGLAGNFILYLLSLDIITPGVAQVVIQLAPVFLLVGGVFMFGESFSKLQFCGLVLLIIGMLLFMNQRLDSLFSELDAYAIGVLLMVAASVTWAIYALMQKKLLKEMRSESILFWVYLGSTIVLLPTASFESILPLNVLGWCLLAFCCANSLVAYGAFAEAMDHLEASRVSAILALTPLMTLLFVAIFHHFFPSHVASENLNLLAYAGALLVVAGSAVTALAGKK